MKAIIPAAGLGSRFLPATKAQPKEMLLVVDRPVIQYIVEEGLASAADEVVIVNSREKKSIEEHFSPNPELDVYKRQGVLLFSESNMPFTVTPQKYYNADGSLTNAASMLGMNSLLEHWAMAIHPPLSLIHIFAALA